MDVLSPYGAPEPVVSQGAPFVAGPVTGQPTRDGTPDPTFSRDRGHGLLTFGAYFHKSGTNCRLIEAVPEPDEQGRGRIGPGVVNAHDFVIA